MKKPPLTYVEFHDHASTSKWESEANFDMRAVPCKAIGWALKEDKTVLALAQCLDLRTGNEEWQQTASNTWYILKSTITKRKKLHSCL
jgi:hypothetical protein